MKWKASVPHRAGGGLGRPILFLAFGSLAFSACSGGTPELPSPRPIVIRSGERLFAEPERMQTIDAWFRPQVQNIGNDPSFMIDYVTRDTPAFPWETLVLIRNPVQDTAKFGILPGFDEAARAFEIYAHYHLMKEVGRLEEFLPGGDGLDEFSLERAILARVSDAWFLARSVYQAVAYDPLEELLYANENGYLDAMILTARGDEFKEKRGAWLKEDPEALERYRSWFVDTFSREPPGLRETG